MGRPFDDERIRAGMARQLAGRAALLESGARPLGWKAGFGSVEALATFGTEGPLVGYLTDATRLEDGALVSLDGWVKPVVETELCVHIGDDVPAGADPGRVRGAIAAIGPAIELADIEPPPEDVEEVLAGDIFHRGVILGEADPGRRGADLDGLRADITVDGDPVPAPKDLEALTGPIPDVVAWVADTLSDAGLSLGSGDVLITGSVVPPIPASPGMEVRFRLDPFPPLTVRFS